MESGGTRALWPANPAIHVNFPSLTFRFLVCARYHQTSFRVLIADFRALGRKACVSITFLGLIRFKNKKEEGWRLLVHFCLAIVRTSLIAIMTAAGAANATI
jgi:hypothetical protein